MSAHELALQKALISRLKADAAVKALLGEPARVWDAAPADGAFPYLPSADGARTFAVLRLRAVTEEIEA